MCVHARTHTRVLGSSDDDGKSHIRLGSKAPNKHIRPGNKAHNKNLCGSGIKPLINIYTARVPPPSHCTTPEDRACTIACNLCLTCLRTTRKGSSTACPGGGSAALSFSIMTTNCAGSTLFRSLSIISTKFGGPVGQAQVRGLQYYLFQQASIHQPGDLHEAIQHLSSINKTRARTVTRDCTTNRQIRARCCHLSVLPPRLQCHLPMMKRSLSQRLHREPRQPEEGIQKDTQWIDQATRLREYM
jgi:hypothetical protein